MGGSSTRNRDSAARQVSFEPASLSKLSRASSTEATPVVVDVLSEEVKCNRPVATQGRQHVLLLAMPPEKLYHPRAVSTWK